MNIRTILVHADSDPRCDMRLGFAADLARKHGAKIFAVFVRRPPAIPVMDGQFMPADIIQSQIDAELKRCQKVRTQTEQKLRSEGVTFEWRDLDGEAAPALARAAAVADLVVMGQGREDLPTVDVATVALTAGCPVLCIPTFGSFPSIGKRILLAWNGSRESARALHDALPFIRDADTVTLFAADEDAEAPATTMDAAARLAAHGAKVEIKQSALAGLDAGNAILNAAADSSADLIIMGAYGHTRLREWVFGGATRTILDSMTVPTILAH